MYDKMVKLNDGKILSTMIKMLFLNQKYNLSEIVQ